MGIDVIHFGVVFQLSVMIGLVTPPVGILLFVISGTGNIPINDILKKIVPFYIAMLVTLLLCVFIPDISLFLVKLFGESII
jgi:TRAP-type C4-dicarboxylate transport system permease large subunit